MTINTLFRRFLFLALAICFVMSTQALPLQSAPLSPRQQVIVRIAVFTARGDLRHLHETLVQGLDAGLTVNEEKEELVHLYAYCGFPRSISGLNTLLQVLDERKAQGKKDVIGKVASPITSTAPKYERGKQVLEQLSGQPETAPKTGYGAFSPEIDRFLKEHLFADIFERDVLTYQERELATIAALVSMGGVEPMLQGHLSIGLHVGLTEAQLRQLMSLETAIGQSEADAGRAVLQKVLASKK